MLNPATRPQGELNHFTANIQVIAKGNWAENYYVRLRNGTLVRPVFKAAEHATEEDVFYGEDGYRYCWNLDGTSVTRRDYDMMEIVREE